jgi:hypothetical protein
MFVFQEKCFPINGLIRVLHQQQEGTGSYQGKRAMGRAHG